MFAVIPPPNFPIHTGNCARVSVDGSVSHRFNCWGNLGGKATVYVKVFRIPREESTTYQKGEIRVVLTCHPELQLEGKARAKRKLAQSAVKEVLSDVCYHNPD